METAKVQEQDDKVWKLLKKLLDKIHAEEHSGKATLEIDCYQGRITTKKLGLVWCEK